MKDWKYKVYEKENDKRKIVKSGSLVACFSYLSLCRTSGRLHIGRFSGSKLLKEIV